MARNRTTKVFSKEKPQKTTVNGYLLNRNGAVQKGVTPFNKDIEFVGKYRPARHTLDII